MADAAALRCAAGGNVAAGVSYAARAVALGVSQTSRNDYGGAEFCVLTVRAEDCRRGHRGAGPKFVPRGAKWRLTRQPRNLGALRGTFLAIRVSARSAASGLRLGGSRAGGDRSAAQPRPAGGPRRA